MPNGPPKFEDLLEAAPDAMVGTDASGVAVFANGARRRCWAAIRSGEPLGELPAALDVTRIADGRVRARRPAPRRPARAARRARQHARRDLPQGPRRALPARQPRVRALHGRPRRRAGRPARPRGPAAGRRRAHARRRPARDVRAPADRAPGGGPPRRADADVPVAQVPADRRRGRRALRRRRRRHRHHAPHAGSRRACARPSGWRRSASSPAASRTTSTTCSR